MTYKKKEKENKNEFACRFECECLQAKTIAFICSLYLVIFPFNKLACNTFEFVIKEKNSAYCVEIISHVIINSFCYLGLYVFHSFFFIHMFVMMHLQNVQQLMNVLVVITILKFKTHLCIASFFGDASLFPPLLWETVKIKS